jgi:8-oxo-dGTP pyrophosphatase MutT (NUDIX family)
MSPPAGGSVVCHERIEAMSEHVEELNPGKPTEPRPAASVILLRRGGRHGAPGIEVLLGKRTPRASFMANAWVFPGGALDSVGAERAPADRDYRAAALRELEEEVSVALEDPDQLVPFSRWITPLEVKVRYDTRFYLAIAPPHCAPQPDEREIVAASWFAPTDALERHYAGEMLLVFPTIKQLEALSEFASADEALAAARSRKVEPVMPKVTAVDGEPRILLPGDPGYDEAG